MRESIRGAAIVFFLPGFPANGVVRAGDKDETAQGMPQAWPFPRHHEKQGLSRRPAGRGAGPWVGENTRFGLQVPCASAVRCIDAPWLYCHWGRNLAVDLRLRCRNPYVRMFNFRSGNRRAGERRTA
jgi:hypothetical protein